MICWTRSSYWFISWLWFSTVAVVYTFVLIAFASAIQLNFFLKTSHAFTIVFFLIWSQTLVSFSFLVRIAQLAICADSLKSMI